MEIVMLALIFGVLAFSLIELVALNKAISGAATEKFPINKTPGGLTPVTVRRGQSLANFHPDESGEFLSSDFAGMGMDIVDIPRPVSRTGYRNSKHRSAELERTNDERLRAEAKANAS